ncbi:hypothetical protein GN956_G16832 [Arapaima gigas]
MRWSAWKPDRKLARVGVTRLCCTAVRAAPHPDFSCSGARGENESPADLQLLLFTMSVIHSKDVNSTSPPGMGGGVTARLSPRTCPIG